MSSTLVGIVVEVSFQAIAGATKLVTEFIEGRSPQPLKIITTTDFFARESVAHIHCESREDAVQLCGELTLFLSRSGGSVTMGSNLS